VRFKPIIRRVDPSSLEATEAVDGDLPPDLVGLGQQMSDDAAWLAERYPATVCPSVTVCPSAVAPPAAGVRGRAQEIIKWISLAAAILAICGTTWITMRTRPALPPTHETVGHVAAQGKERPYAPITDRVLDAGEAYILAADRNSAEGLIVPAAFFQSLSGPEQEGLLDLLDEMVPEAIDLSM
jgi:hypothetical protein